MVTSVTSVTEHVEDTPSAPRSQKTAVLLAHRIVDEIIARRLPAGSRLPYERDMLLEFGVGRGTLREALRYLELQGVLEIRVGAGGGPIVAQPDGHNLASALSLMLALRRTPFSEVVTIRQALEPPMARLAATHATDAEITAIRASHERMMDESLTDEEFLEENRRFHSLIASASGSAVFEYFMASLDSIFEGIVVGVTYNIYRRRGITRAHESVVEAIEARDPESAAAAMAYHLDDWAAYMASKHTDALNRPVAWREASRNGANSTASIP